MEIKLFFLLRAVLLVFFVGFLSAPTTFADNKSKLPPDCQIDCITPYGEILGVSKSGVEAYSNCNSKCVIYEPNKWKGTYTGIKWQCVEYARRWLLLNKGAVYGDVENASDIWDKIDYLTEIKTKSKLPLISYVNGSKLAPQIGDMLIYANEFNNTGHVAIVIDVDIKNGILEVGEQNFNNQSWSNKYARKINLITRNNQYWLLDAYLLGWKHIK